MSGGGTAPTTAGGTGLPSILDGRAPPVQLPPKGAATAAGSKVPRPKLQASTASTEPQRNGAKPADCGCKGKPAEQLPAVAGSIPDDRAFDILLLLFGLWLAKHW